MMTLTRRHLFTAAAALTGAALAGRRFFPSSWAGADGSGANGVKALCLYVFGTCVDCATVVARMRTH